MSKAKASPFALAAPSAAKEKRRPRLSALRGGGLAGVSSARPLMRVFRKSSAWSPDLENTNMRKQ